MSKQLEVGIGADTGPFDKAIRSGIIDPLEDVDKALDDLGKNRGADDLADDLDDAAKRTEDLKDETRETARAIERDYKSAGDGIGDSTRKGLGRAKEGLADFKDESNSTAREAAASFDGSAQSIGDAFQEVAANAFAGFGPAGAVAGIAAAAGIGLVISAFENVADAQEASEEEIAKWADAYIEAGDRVLNASQVIAGAQEIITDPERWKEAQKDAKLWGVSVETAVLAMSGNAASIDTVSRSLDNQREAYLDYAASIESTSEGRDKELAKLAEANSAYKTLTDGISQGQVAAGVYNQALLDLIASTEDATTQTDDLGNTVYSLPGGKQILVKADTKQATEDLSTFHGNLDEVPKQKVTTVKVNVDDSAWRMWRPVVKQGIVTTKPAHGGTFWE